MATRRTLRPWVGLWAMVLGGRSERQGLGVGWQAYSLGPTQLGVLRLEQIELLGEEHCHHEEQEQDEGGRAHGHAHHLEVGDDGLTARPLVPDVVLRVAPAVGTG